MDGTVWYKKGDRAKSHPFFSLNKELNRVVSRPFDLFHILLVSALF